MSDKIGPPGGASTNGTISSSNTITPATSPPPTIDSLIEDAEESNKLRPNAPPVKKARGYLQAKIDYNKPILGAMLSECPPTLHPFLPYDSTYENTKEVRSKWYKPTEGTYTIGLLPSQSEIDSADLMPLYKGILAFVKDRLDLKDANGNVFSEKVTSSSVVVTCVVFTTLVKIFNGASGSDLLAKLSTYQSFIATMQTLLLDKYDSDGKLAKSFKSVRGKSNDPTGQSAFACLNHCSSAAEKKKKEVRSRCFKESLPRVDGIHSTLSTLRKGLLMLFLRVHHNLPLPADFDYLLNGDSESVEKPAPIFMNNDDFPIGLSTESAELLRLIKRDGLFSELVNVATSQLVAALDEPNANEAVEFALGAKSVIDQTKSITYSVMLGERGLLKKFQIAEASMSEKDQTPIMYPMLMCQFEHAPSLFLGCVVMRKLTSDLFMAQIQLANLTPIVASEAIEAYTLALAEFATNLRNFITRLNAARDHIASMSRFGFALNYVGVDLLAALTGEGDDNTSTSHLKGGSSTVSEPPAITPAGVASFLHYFTTLTTFKTSKHSLRYLNEIGKLAEDIQQNVDLLFEHIKALRSSTDVVKSYAMMEQAITDLRKFSNVVSNATGKVLTLHDKPLEDFKMLLASQAEMVLTKRAAVRRANDISLALSNASHIGASPTSHIPTAASSPLHTPNPDICQPGVHRPHLVHQVSDVNGYPQVQPGIPRPTSGFSSYPSSYGSGSSGVAGGFLVHDDPNYEYPGQQQHVDPAPWNTTDQPQHEPHSRMSPDIPQSRLPASQSYSGSQNSRKTTDRQGEPSLMGPRSVIHGPGPFVIEDPEPDDGPELTSLPSFAVRADSAEDAAEPSVSRAYSKYGYEPSSYQPAETAAGGIYDHRSEADGYGGPALPLTSPPSPTRSSHHAYHSSNGRGTEGHQHHHHQHQHHQQHRLHHTQSAQVSRHTSPGVDNQTRGTTSQTYISSVLSHNTSDLNSTGGKKIPIHNGRQQPLPKRTSLH